MNDLQLDSISKGFSYRWYINRIADLLNSLNKNYLRFGTLYNENPEQFTKRFVDAHVERRINLYIEFVFDRYG